MRRGLGCQLDELLELLELCLLYRKRHTLGSRMRTTEQKRLFAGAIRVYLVYLLNQYQQYSVHLDSLSHLQVFETWSDEIWKAVLASCRRVTTCIANCQNDDERGLHPFFAVEGLAVIDKAIVCLNSSLEAAYQYGRPFYSSYEENARACTRFVKTSLSVLVAERTGDSELASVYKRVIERNMPTSTPHLSKASQARAASYYDSNLATKAIQRAIEQTAMAAAAEVDGKGDLARVLRLSARVARMQHAHQLDNKQSDNHSPDKPLYCYNRAYQCAELAVEYFTANYSACHTYPGVRKLLLQIAHAMEDHAQRWSALARDIETGNANRGSMEQETERQVRDAKQLYDWYLNLSKLDIDLMEQQNLAEDARSAASNCSHPETALLWSTVAEAHEESSSILTALFSAIGSAGTSPNDIMLLRDSELKQQHFASRLRKETVTLSGEAVRLVHLQKLVQQGFGETALEKARRDCWQSALHHIEIAVQSGLNALNAADIDNIYEQSLSSEIARSFVNHKAFSACYMRIAASVLNTAEQYSRRARATPGLGYNPHWQTASDCLVRSALLRMQKLSQMTDQEVTSIMHGHQSIIYCLEAENLEKIVEYWLRVAEQWTDNYRVQQQATGNNVQITLRNDALTALVAAAEAFSDDLQDYSLRVYAPRSEYELTIELISTLEDPQKGASAEVIAIQTDCVRWANAKALLVRDGNDETAVNHYTEAISWGQTALKSLTIAPGEAALCYNAAYYKVCSWEAKQQSQEWLALVYKCIVHHLVEATQSRLFHLHCAVAKGLMALAAPIRSGDNCVQSAPTLTLPSTEDARHALADEVIRVQLVIVLATCQMKAWEDANNNAAAQQWSDVKDAAKLLVDALIREASKEAGEYAYMYMQATKTSSARLLLSFRMRLADPAAEQAWSPGVLTHLEAGAQLLQQSRCCGEPSCFEYLQAQRHRAAADAMEKGQSALVSALEAAIAVAADQQQQHQLTSGVIKSNNQSSFRELVHKNIVLLRVREADLRVKATLTASLGHGDAELLYQQAKSRIRSAIAVLHNLKTTGKKKSQKGKDPAVAKLEAEVEQLERQAAALCDLTAVYF